VALGVVLLWGRVIQHTDGYRAEYARPLKLLRVPAQRHADRVNTLLDAIAERYTIRIVTRATDLP
jgi:hypothetical protein